MKAKLKKDKDKDKDKKMSAVLKHLKEDKKEFKEQIKDDDRLAKIMQKKSKKCAMKK